MELILDFLEFICIFVMHLISYISCIIIIFLKLSFHIVYIILYILNIIENFCTTFFTFNDLIKTIIIT